MNPENISKNINNALMKKSTNSANLTKSHLRFYESVSEVTSIHTNWFMKAFIILLGFHHTLSNGFQKPTHMATRRFRNNLYYCFNGCLNP